MQALRKFWAYRKNVERNIGKVWGENTGKNAGKGVTTTIRVFLMELFATFLFVTIILLPAIRAYNVTTIATVEAVAVFGITAVFLKESVGYLNPLMLAAVYVSGRAPYPWWMFFIQFVALTLGWIVGTATDIAMTVGISASAGLGAPSVNPMFTIGQALFAEIYGTVLNFGIPLFYMLALHRRTLYGDLIYSGSANAKNVTLIYPFIVSFFHALAFIFTFDVTGASLNWYRYLFPTVIGGTFDASSQWIYFVGPLLGAVLSGIAFCVVLALAKHSTVKNMDELKDKNEGKYEEL